MLAARNTLDIKKYSFEAILKRFKDETKQLESDNGCIIQLQNGTETVHATLASVVGDTLAVQEILGFLKSLCRLFL